jgi:hypothetical protein
MSERLNKTSICSVVFLDIVDQSKKPVAEQIKDKELFNGFINEAIKDVAQNDRILLDTGDGAAIALLGAPEEALFVAMTIRDSIVKYNHDHNHKLFVRTGINLGPVRVVSDINGRPNILGDGINVAERVMSFAVANQILVSRSYYEITSRLTEEITGMFAYFGIKQDTHVREHEVYMIRSPEDESASAAAAVVEEVKPATRDKEAPVAWLPGLLNNENLSKYLLWAGGALVLVAVSISGFMLAGNLINPDLGDVAANTTPAPAFSTNIPATPASPQPVTAKGATPAVAPEPKKNVAKAAPAVESVANKDVVKAEPRKRKAKASKKKEAEPVPAPPESTAVATNPTPQHNSEPVKAHEPVAEEKSGWAAFKESVKQGREEKVCTQAERALHQCS